MTNLIFKKTNNAPWPVKAQAQATELTFSGSLDPVRINKEKTSDRLAILSKISLWLLLGLGATSLLLSAFQGLQQGDWLFFFRHSRANLAVWVTSYTSCYLWARLRQQRLNEAALNLLHWEEHAKEAQNSQLDIYGLFNSAARKAWNRAFVFAQARQQRNNELLDNQGKQKEKSVAIKATDLFLSLLEDRDVKLLFMRMGTNPQYPQTLVKNFELLSAQKNLNELDQVPFLAFSESLNLHNKAIDPLMLLCGLVKDLPEEHIINSIFFNINLSLEKIETLCAWIFNLELLRRDLKIFHKLAKFRPEKEVNRGLTAVPTYYLDRFSTDLTALAKYGGLPLAYGRGHDLTEVFALLASGKSNLVIKGPEGSGRTTLINELAYKMVTEQVPPILEDKRLVRLEIAAILGDMQRAESAFIRALKEAAKTGNIILVIEDMHALARAQSGSGLTLLEMLIDFLQNNDLLVLGTTTVEDFSDYLQDTPSFTETFSSYELSELGNQGVLLACCIRTSLLEIKNRCFFRYPAIEQAVELTDLYVKGISQPQKAIAVLVEAASRTKNSPSKIVTEELVEKIVSEKTHIPTRTLSQDEAEKLLNLEAEMGKFIIGQKQAVKAVCEGLRRARSGLSSTVRPLASFLFLGPTGVGKTEIAKTLARIYFGDAESDSADKAKNNGEKFLLRLDMSEYQGEEGLTKLLGSESSKLDTPLVKHVKNYPFCLLLLDELEKASREVLNLFLQVLEDGRLTSGKGEILDLTHALIIATSNAGTLEIQQGLKAQRSMEQIKIQLFNQTLTKVYPPELLNRFDGIVLFCPLDSSEVEQITHLQLQYLKERLKDKGIKIEFSEAIARHISQNAFDPLLGARPIRRYIQDFVESFIAKLLLSKQAQRGTELKVDIQDGSLIVK